MRQLLLDIVPGWTPTLANFEAGRNIELLTALRHALDETHSERCFYLWGAEGCGKTHLLRAAADHASALHIGAAYACGEVPEAASVVAVDEVERLDAEQQIELFALYNRQRETGGMLLVSGKAAPAHLQSLRDDLRTRLGWGLVYQVQGLSDEEKMGALARHAEQRGFELPVEVSQYLLRHGRRDLPSLLATLDALDARSLELKRSPSVPLLKEVLAGR